MRKFPHWIVGIPSKCLWIDKRLHFQPSQSQSTKGWGVSVWTVSWFWCLFQTRNFLFFKGPLGKCWVCKTTTIHLFLCVCASEQRISLFSYVSKMHVMLSLASCLNILHPTFPKWNMQNPGCIQAEIVNPKYVQKRSKVLDDFLHQKERVSNRLCHIAALRLPKWFNRSSRLLPTKVTAKDLNITPSSCSLARSYYSTFLSFSFAPRCA